MIYRLGDIFKTTDDNGNYTIAYNSITYYCKLMNIVDLDGNYYNELDVITGSGYKNTKVILHLKMLCNEKLEECKQNIIKRDPHKAYKVNIKNELKRIEIERELLNKKDDFFKRNKRLDIKLKELGI